MQANQPSVSQLADQFALNGALIPSLFAGLSEAELRRPGPDGKWSAFMNLAHLGQFHTLMLSRLERMQREPDTVFERFVPDEDPLLAQWAARDWATFQRDFAAARADFVATLRALPDSAAGCSATHARFGRLSLPGWLAFWQLHDGHHLLTAAQRARL